MADRKPIYWNGSYSQQFAAGDTVGIADGGTGATTASQARTNLGLAIGSDVQAYDADLAAIAAFAGTGMAVRTGAGTWALRSLTAGTSISITNVDGSAGNPTIALATLADAGGGSLLKLTRAATGLVAGTSAVGTSDLTPLLNGTYAPINNPTFTGAVTLPGDPGSALQAATKQYVDAVAAGGTAPWPSVRVVTTTNDSLSGLAARDGVTLTAGDRVLVAGQSTGSANGFYVAAAGAWARATDANTSAHFAPGRQVFVNEGTTYADSTWALTNDTAPTIGTTAITFTQINGLGQIVAGAGLTKTGNTLDVGTASSARIVVNADNIDLALVTNSGSGTFLKLATDGYGRVTGTTPVLAADVAALLDSDLTALANNATNGLWARTGTGTGAARSIAVASTSRLTVTNADGVAGNPTLDLATIGTPGTYGTVTVDAYGRITSGSAPGNATAVTDAATNGEASAIAIGRAVYASASGQVKLANANAAGTTQVIGLVADTSIGSGASGQVAFSGVLAATTTQWDAVTGQTGGLTFGATYFLSNTTNGALTTTAPSSGFAVPVGVALSTTKLVLGIGQPLQL